MVAAVMFTGCSTSERAGAVDADVARQALAKALDGWKNGDEPSALSKAVPPITAQDLDWLTGAKLVNYAMSGEGTAREANLYVPVTLTMKTAKGKEVKKNVTYVVGTSPRLTVFRALP
jgi:hypothetical protein